jgi:hypothetical protein
MRLSEESVAVQVYESYCKCEMVSHHRRHDARNALSLHVLIQHEHICLRLADILLVASRARDPYSISSSTQQRKGGQAARSNVRSLPCVVWGVGTDSAVHATGINLHDRCDYTRDSMTSQPPSTPGTPAPAPSPAPAPAPSPAPRCRVRNGLTF